jgi:nickel/cobalt transporter (NicO) family protein
MNPGRTLLALLGAVGLSIAVAVPAFAHPLGNFTINRFSQVQLDGDRIDILYVIDYAEIPAFQEKQRIADDPRYVDQRVRSLSGGLSLQVAGHRLQLMVADHSVAFLPGQGGLQTMRLQIALRTGTLDSGQHSATYRDSNYAGRLGWKEIVVQAAAGARLLTSSAPDRSVSNELRHYPQDMLTSPLDVTSASFAFVPGASSSGQSPSSVVGAGQGGGFIADRFAALIAPSQLSLSLFLLSLVSAMALGALHALSPGHGKAVMAAYLVGARGTPRHAIGLGLTITATHTAGVFLLGLVTLYAAALVTPERLYPWVTMLSGLLIVAIGSALVLSRAQAAVHRREHDHGHGDHQHAQPALGRRSLLALGISSGIIPCPSALVVLLAAISLHRVPFGILLIVAFSAGLATTLTGIGLVLAGGLPLVLRLRAATGHRIVGRAMQFVPVASALIVIIAGLGLTVQAIPGVR